MDDDDCSNNFRLLLLISRVFAIFQLRQWLVDGRKPREMRALRPDWSVESIKTKIKQLRRGAPDQLTCTRFFFFSGLVRLVLKHGPKSLTVEQVFVWVLNLQASLSAGLRNESLWCLPGDGWLQLWCSLRMRCTSGVRCRRFRHYAPLSPRPADRGMPVDGVRLETAVYSCGGACAGV